jgi:hypothetical protein
MGRRTVVLDCSALVEADAEQLEAIARLCLGLKRAGARSGWPTRARGFST